MASLKKERSRPSRHPLVATYFKNSNELYHTAKLLHILVDDTAALHYNWKNDKTKANFDSLVHSFVSIYIFVLVRIFPVKKIKSIPVVINRLGISTEKN